MNKLYRWVLIALVLAVAVPGMAMATQFSDVAPEAWYAGTVAKLSGTGVIGGYPDGTFKPQGQITRAEFTKLLVFAAGKKYYESRLWLQSPIYEVPAPGSHWAADVINFARKFVLIQKDEFQEETWDQPILRKEMDQEIARGLVTLQQEKVIEDTAPYVAKITDWATTCETCKPEIAQAYAKGIIAGMPDGSFAGEQPATRAEASAMILRLIEPATRVNLGVEIPVKPFDPATDVLEDGRMKMSAAEPYLMELADSLKFYKGGNGKYFLSGNMPALPEGYEILMGIVFYFKDNSPSYGIVTDNKYLSERAKDPQYNQIISHTGTFNVEIVRVKSLSGVKEVTAGASILKSGAEWPLRTAGSIAFSNVELEKMFVHFADNDDYYTVYYDLRNIFQW
jgi:hypothetical protein